MNLSNPDQEIYPILRLCTHCKEGIFSSYPDITPNTSAIKVLAEIICLPADMSAKQWIAYAGLDPRTTESGTSINKPSRITKSGNKYLRTALLCLLLLP